MDVLPQGNEAYGRMEYWDQRYSKEDPSSSFDWFKTYADLKDLLNKHIPDKRSRIIMLGCGNSTLSRDMYDDGYHSIVNVDYSSIVIDRMKALHQIERPETEWMEADVRSLPFPDGSFDIAIDKGTMDAMMTAKGDVWDPPPQVKDDCKREVDEVTRILRPGQTSRFLYITFGQPHFRKPHLRREGWDLEVIEMGDAFHYYFYTLKRIS